MHVKDILPWNWGKKNVPVRRDARFAGERYAESGAPLVGWPGLLEQLVRFGPGRLPWSSEPGAEENGFLPALDASETDDEIRITLELPGMSEKDIEVSLDPDAITIRGEKRQEYERDEGGAHWIERRFGSFQRSVPLPCEVDEDRVQASFRNAVLSIVLPKRVGERSAGRKISIFS
jgi:HSP20 family protein